MNFESGKIIYENDDILVIDKKSGFTTNRSSTNKTLTLQDELSLYFNLADGDFGIGGRAGIVHRLDRETSGLIVVAKAQKTFDFLQKQFRDRKVKKEYLALVHGLTKEDNGVISGDIGRVGKFGKFGIVAGGRGARTLYNVLVRYKFIEDKFSDILNKEGLHLTKPRINYYENHAKDYTLLKLLPESGRTHQIRVHLKSIGHNVVSDSIYAPSKLLRFDLSWCPRLFLHASYLKFKVLGEGNYLEFKSDLPNNLKNAILVLKELKA